MNNGINEAKISCLYLFDYLSNYKSSINKNNFKFINIAGNLSKNKAGYVYKLNDLKIKNYVFNLYGINYDGVNNDRIVYKGSFAPDILITELNSGFGLVWDGDSIDTCSGAYGDYLKINNPHKLSLYMAAGMPVIVWKESAISKFVLENKVGFVIESIEQIDNIIFKITSEEYEEYLKNVKMIQNKVLKGEFLLEALKR